MRLPELVLLGREDISRVLRGVKPLDLGLPWLSDDIPRDFSLRDLGDDLGVNSPTFSTCPSELLEELRERPTPL